MPHHHCHSSSGRIRLALCGAICGIAAAAFAATGCSEPKVSDRDLTHISIDDATELVDGRSGVLGIGTKSVRVVDPRSRAKFEAGRIPGAINLSLEDVRIDHPQLRNYDVLMVYGDDFNEPIAIAMCKRLLAVGYRDVRMIQGGLRAWQRAGHPVVTGES